MSFGDREEIEEVRTMALTPEVHGALRTWLLDEGFVLARTRGHRTRHTGASIEVGVLGAQVRG